MRHGFYFTIIRFSCLKCFCTRFSYYYNITKCFSQCMDTIYEPLYTTSWISGRWADNITEVVGCNDWQLVCNRAFTSQLCQSKRGSPNLALQKRSWKLESSVVDSFTWTSSNNLVYIGDQEHSRTGVEMMAAPSHMTRRPTTDVLSSADIDIIKFKPDGGAVGGGGKGSPEYNMWAEHVMEKYRSVAALVVYRGEIYSLLLGKATMCSRRRACFSVALQWTVLLVLLALQTFIHTVYSAHIQWWMVSPIDHTLLWLTLHGSTECRGFKSHPGQLFFFPWKKRACPECSWFDWPLPFFLVVYTCRAIVAWLCVDVSQMILCWYSSSETSDCLSSHLNTVPN